MTRRGFTFAEMIATTTVIAVVAVAVTPIFTGGERLNVMAAAELLASDIELARTMSMADRQHGVVVGFSPTGTAYWLADEATPTTPMVREDTGETYYVSFGSGRGKAAEGVAFTLSGMAGTKIEFDEHGVLTDFSSTPVIGLRVGSDKIDVTVSPTTGSVSYDWVEAEDEDLAR